MQKKTNITILGGGKGSYGMLSSLKQNSDYNLSSIISMSDSGGSTGQLMKEFDTLPVGDLRRGIMALSSGHENFRQLFDYRFPSESSVGGHCLGNLIITAMADINGDFDKGLKQTSKMFKVKGRVLPCTLEKNELCVELEDGQIIYGETNIDEPKHDENLKITRAFLDPAVGANPKAIRAIEKSDIIILCFGDLYTSLLPNLLAEGISDAIKSNKDAQVLYFCNLMTKPGETSAFELIDFIDTVEKYLGTGIINTVIVNNGYISDEMAEKYKKLENKSPVKLKDKKSIEGKSYQVLERDLLHENAFVRHSFDKIAKVIEEIVENQY